MTLSARTLAALAALGSAALLAGALLFQYVGGLPPCDLCILQRWPHVAAVAMGLLAVVLGPLRAICALGAAAAMTTSGIGLYHVGVEQGWWKGPETCSGGQGAGLTTDQLLDAIRNAPVVRCTDIAWEFLGISMAGWNALISLALAAIWIAAAVKARPRS